MLGSSVRGSHLHYLLHFIYIFTLKQVISIFKNENLKPLEWLDDFILCTDSYCTTITGKIIHRMFNMNSSLYLKNACGPLTAHLACNNL